MRKRAAKIKSLDDLTERLGNLSLLSSAAYAEAGWDRQRGLDNLKRDVEDAFDECAISESQYNALLARIREIY